MLTNFRCEVCGRDAWEILGTRRYLRSDADALSEYKRKRYQVLFGEWFPGEDEVVLASQLCKFCGFLVYSPRPEVKDVDAKYNSLIEQGQDYGRGTNEHIDRRRSQGIFSYVHKFSNKKGYKTILDYGGGDGRLMQAFLSKNKDCFVYDYNSDAVPGVSKVHELGAVSKKPLDFYNCLC